MGGGKYKSNLPLNLEAIQACGYKNVMVSTDGGQVENPFWEAATDKAIAATINKLIISLPPEYYKFRSLV